MKFNAVLARLLFCLGICAAPLSMVFAETETLDVSAEPVTQDVSFNSQGRMALIRPGHAMVLRKRFDLARVRQECEFVLNVLIQNITALMTVKYGMSEDLVQDLEVFARKFAVSGYLLVYRNAMPFDVPQFVFHAADESSLTSKIFTELGLEDKASLATQVACFVEQVTDDVLALIGKHWPAFDLGNLTRSRELFLTAIKSNQDLSGEDKTFIEGSLEEFKKFVLPSLIDEKIEKEIASLESMIPQLFMIAAASAQIPTLLEIFSEHGYSFSTSATTTVGFQKKWRIKASCLDDFYVVYDFASNTLYTKLPVTKDDSLNMDGGFKGYFSYADDGSVIGIVVAPCLNVVTSADANDAIQSFDVSACMAVAPEPNFIVFNA